MINYCMDCGIRLKKEEIAICDKCDRKYEDGDQKLTEKLEEEDSTPETYWERVEITEFLDQ